MCGNTSTDKTKNKKNINIRNAKAGQHVTINHFIEMLCIKHKQFLVRLYYLNDIQLNNNLKHSDLALSNVAKNG